MRRVIRRAWQEPDATFGSTIATTSGERVMVIAAPSSASHGTFGRPGPHPSARGTQGRRDTSMPSSASASASASVASP